MDFNTILASVGSSTWVDSLPSVIHSFAVKDAVDIIISSFFIYVVFVFIKQTRSYFIFTTLAMLLIVSYVAELFNLGLTRVLFQPILTFFLVIFVIVFQREIRRFFRWFTLSRQTLGRNAAALTSEISGIIVHAVQDMAKVKMGALVILSGDYPLDDIIEGGFSLDGKISSPLILSIFDHTTPGHDGAMIIENKRIKRFGVHLPLAEDFKGFATMGTRHRAAVGISERTDALAIVVSEERGTMSVAENGVLKTLQNAGELDDIIKRFLKENHTDEEAPNIWKYMLVHNFYLKIMAVVTAFVLWFVLVLQAGVVSEDLTIPVTFKHLPDSLTVSQVSPDDMSLTFSGEGRDIQNLNVNTINVSVDLSTTTPGDHYITIDKNEISYPSYLTLTRIFPDSLRVTVVTTASTTNVESAK